MNPYKSKLVAAIKKGIARTIIKKKSIILYLGAASGTTASYMSEMIGEEGLIFAVDFAPRVVRDLIFVSQKNKNIAPILADVNHPEQYIPLVTQVDLLYQDVAQPNQFEIFLKNTHIFLKKNGIAILIVKADSIDVTKKPEKIFKDIETKLKKHMTIIDNKNLSPYQKNHCFFVCKK